MAEPPPATLRLSTTSSVRDSGLLEPLCEAFTGRSGLAVEVRAVGTGSALRLGRRGQADAVLVHHAPSELQFVEAGHGVNRREIMTNDFVLVGPPRDPAKVGKAENVFDALAAVFRAGAPFVSRADDSGTNLREIDLWAAAAALPFGRPWYEAATGGMEHCLEAASRAGAYTLADSATFRSHARGLALRVLCRDARHLRNAYSVIAVNPARHAGVNYEGAMALITFLTGREGQSLIRKFPGGGEPLFRPVWCPPPAGGPKRKSAGRSAARKKG